MPRHSIPRVSVDTGLRHGEALAKAGRSAEAIACYQGILQLHPQQPAANYRLGLLLGGSEGLALLRTANAVDPANVTYALAYAEALLTGGRPAEALMVAQQAAQRGAGTEATALVQRARQVLSGDIAGAIPESEMAVLVGLYNEGNLRKAESAALAALERYPQSGELWKLLGVVLKIQGKDGLAAMLKAVHYLPGDALAHSNLGVCLNDLGRHEEAVASLQRALALAPESADGHNNLGVALKSAGRLAEAVRHYQLALQCRPEFDRALNNLGNALRELKRPDEAEIHLRAALVQNPAYADAHNNLGSVLRAQGKPQEALACFEWALKLRPEFAEACTNMGSVLRELARPEPALAYLQRAVQLKPNYADGYCNLGSALNEYGHHSQALLCLQQSLALKPDSAVALTNYALVLRDLSRGKEAEAVCRRALELEPDSISTRTCMGGLMADAGEFDEAERLFRSAIEAAPDAVEAWAGIARLRKMRRGDAESDAWLENVQRLMAGSPEPRSEAYLRFALGKYLDDVGDYGAAFAHLQRANEIARGQRPPYDRSERGARLEQQLRVQDGAWIRRLASVSSAARASARPLFIVGMPRSGTSLAEQILASHPSVCGAGELGYWELAAATMAQCTQSAQAALLVELRDGYLQLLHGYSADASHVVDKMPGNFRHLGLIHAAFPYARIIHMQRHPIDTCLSIFSHQFGAGLAFANDLDDLAHYYRGYQRMMAHWHAVLPPGVLFDLPYEALVTEQESWTRKLLDFVGLPWEGRCLDFHETRRVVSTASNWQVRQKINSASVERWRRYEAAVGAKLDPLLRLVGVATQDNN